MDGTTTVVGAQLAWAVISAYLLQWLKRLSIVPLVNFDTTNINRLIAIIFAAATSSGISIVFNRVNGTILLTGITAPVIYHFISNTVQQFALQHAVYKGIIAPPLAGPIQQSLRNGNGGKL